MIMTRMHALESLLITLMVSMSVHGAQAQPASAAADHPASAPSQAEWPGSRGDDEGLTKADDDEREHQSHRHRHRHDDSLFNLGSNSELRAGEEAGSVVAIFGSSTSAGVANDVGAIFGNARVTGPVKESVFAIFGNVYIDGPVGEDVIAVFGNVELGPHADVRGDVSAVLGSVTRDPAALVGGDVTRVGGSVGGFGWLHPWIEHCLLYGRPLALASGIGWAWSLALGFLALYVCLALLFPGSVSRCVATLETAPGMSLVAALLTLLLTPIALGLLFITMIGIGAIPFLLFGLFCMGSFGKVVMLAWLGRRCVGGRGPGAAIHSALAVTIGGIVVLALYLVPVLGFIVYKVLGILGLGVVAYTLVLASRANRAPAAGAPGGTFTPPPAPAAGSAALPRAGFWIRMAALLIDALLVGILLGVVHRHGDFFLVVLAIYGAAMWKLRGSTVGGIVFDLQVVRLDDRPIGWETAIVRALGCFLSLVVVGLGFFWIAFDHGKQAWHDKIAGTIVVRVPKGGVSLV